MRHNLTGGPVRRHNPLTDSAVDNCHRTSAIDIDFVVICDKRIIKPWLYKVVAVDADARLLERFAQCRGFGQKGLILAVVVNGDETLTGLRHLRSGTRAGSNHYAGSHKNQTQDS